VIEHLGPMLAAMRRRFESGEALAPDELRALAGANAQAFSEVELAVKRGIGPAEAPLIIPARAMPPALSRNPYPKRIS
jgi:hypothetical protein